MKRIILALVILLMVGCTAQPEVQQPTVADEPVAVEPVVEEPVVDTTPEPVVMKTIDSTVQKA
ncbi:MAG: hypothetical protein KJ601_06565, partial [Nanoarchaeota archaeon]|nr:hypothetical protein [Nanoarchaeota archaeon]